MKIKFLVTPNETPSTGVNSEQQRRREATTLDWEREGKKKKNELTQKSNKLWLIISYKVSSIHIFFNDEDDDDGNVWWLEKLVCKQQKECGLRAKWIQININ